MSYGKVMYVPSAIQLGTVSQWLGEEGLMTRNSGYKEMVVSSSSGARSAVIDDGVWGDERRVVIREWWRDLGRGSAGLASRIDAIIARHGGQKFCSRPESEPSE